jgi:hypothetical protein
MVHPWYPAACLRGDPLGDVEAIAGRHATPENGNNREGLLAKNSSYQNLPADEMNRAPDPATMMQ